ncbi:MAG: HAD-IB family hydrolase [Spirochaetes bacterium]|nr:HAD-IB family hydrolase [Spirochaetota bacterium]
MNRYVAFFDLDHTILDTSSALLYLQYLRDQELIGKFELTKGVILSLLHRAGFFTTEDVIKKWVKKYEGVSENETIEHARRWFEKMVKSHIRLEAFKEIKRHRENGARTVILSASTNYGCEPIKTFLGMDDIISTKLEVRNGILTGNLEGEYCYGQVKLTKAMEYCIQHNFDMDTAWYYGDAIADIHILERVGHPVCVTPDKKLHKIAIKRGWPIVQW